MAERIEVIIDGQSAGYVRAAAQAETASRRLGQTTGTQTKAVSAFNDVGAQQVRNLQAIGRYARYAGAGLAGVFAYGLYQGVKAGVDFEQQMARVQAVSNASAKEMDGLRRQAIQLGRDTKFSAGEAASAMYELSSAGFSVAQVHKALPGTLSLAAASNIELADAAEISSNALRGFGLQSKESTHVADVLAQSVNSSSVEMQDLQLSLKYIGPVANATGESFEEMIAAVSLMGDAGIKGEQAGTTLRGGLIRLVKPTKMVKEGLASLGLDVEDLQGPNGLLPLNELVGKLQGGLEGMSKAQQAQALASIFGNEALSGMLAVIDAGPEKVAKLTREFEHSDGASKKAANTMNRTVAGAWENFTGSLETVEIGLFEHFEQPLRKALLEGADLVNHEGKEITDWLDSITDTPEFKQADLQGKLKIIGDALGEEALQGFNWALEHMAEAAAEHAPDVVAAFGHAFVSSNVWGQLALGAFVISKLGLGPSMLRAAGQGAAKEVASGFTQVSDGVMMQSGATGGRGLLKGIGAGLLMGAGIEGVMQAAFTSGGIVDTLNGQGATWGRDLGNALADAFGDQVERAIQHKSIPALKQLSSTLNDLVAGFENAGMEVPDAMREMADRTTAALNRMQISAADLRYDIKSLRNSVADDVGDISARTEQNMRKIERSFGSHSKKGQQLLSANYDAAIHAIDKAMDEGEISTDRGMQAINDLIRKRLALFGIKGPDAEKIIVASTDKSGVGHGLQEGGPTFEGHIVGPGRTGDRHHIIGEDGEYMLNREAVKAIGVHNLDRVNYGMYPRFQEGGLLALAEGGAVFPHRSYPMLSGDTDMNPKLGEAMSRMAAAAHTAIYVNSGGRTTAEQVGLQGGPNPAAAPGQSNHEFVNGAIAADIAPGNEKFGGMAGRFGLGFPLLGIGEPWHIELLNAAAAALGGGAKGAGAAAFSLELQRFSSPYAAFVPAAEQLNLVSKALEREIADRVGPVGGGVGAIGSVPTGPIQQMARQMVEQIWGAGQWGAFEQLEMSEAGWDPKAVNPTSGAAGLPQALPASKLPDGAWPYQGLESAKLQLQWMMGYIKERYGDPASAWAFHQANNWYQKGGPIGLIGDSLGVGMKSVGFPGGWKTDVESGRPSSGGLGPLKKMLDLDPAAIVWELGTNDGSASQTASALQRVREMLGDDVGLALMTTHGEKNAGAINDVITGFGRADAIANWAGIAGKYDLDSMGIHPGPDGYRAMHDLVREAANKAKERAGGDDGEHRDHPPIHFDGGAYDPDGSLLASADDINANTPNLAGKIANVKERIDEIQDKLEQSRLSEETRAQISKLKDRLAGSGLSKKKRRDLKAELAELQGHREDLSPEQRKQLQDQQKALEERLAALREAMRKKRERRAKALQKKGLSAKLREQLGATEGRDDDLIERIDIAERLASAESGAGTDGGSDMTQGEVDKLGGLYNERLGVLGVERDQLNTLLARLGDRVAADQKLIDDKDTPKWKRQALRANRNAANDLIADARSQLENVQGRTGDGGYIFDVNMALADLGVTSNDDTSAFLADFYKQKSAADSLRANLSEAQFGVMAQFFRELPGLPYIGAFAAGSRGLRVGTTGMAMLHRDEQIVPDPEGPYGTQAGVGSSDSGGGPSQLVLYVDSDLAPLMSRVRAEIDGRQVAVTKTIDHSIGRAARQRSLAPGR